MPFEIPVEIAQANYPEYQFITPLAPSAQKAAFHVKDAQGQNLCLKIISPDYGIDRLHREIIALQKLTHPNIVKLKEYTFSSTEDSQRHYMIEEFIEGNDLTEFLSSGEQWSTSEAATFFAELCDGLNALKEIKIVHRDLKPSNIRVRLSGGPVIIDFGTARHLDLTDLTETSDGAGIGTPAYFSPEQFTGTKHDIDHRTDLFALGIILYQAMVGCHPFWKKDTYGRAELQEAVCNSRDCLKVQEFAALPQKWQLIITKLLEKERSNRPQNAGQVATILRKI